MASGIYQILNLQNGKRYVGSAVTLHRRWKLHRYQLRNGSHHSQHLQNAWNKHGAESFAFSVLELADRESLIAREQHWMDSTSPEYNVLRIAGSSLGHKASPETRAKISASLMGHKINVGRKHSEETKLKIRAAHVGRPRTQGQIEALRAANASRQCSDETRAAMSLARTGTKRSAETRARMAESARKAHARRKEAKQCAC